jgi:hypothetical protein
MGRDKIKRCVALWSPGIWRDTRRRYKVPAKASVP